VTDELYLTSKNNPPHGLQLQNDRAFEHNVGYEVSNNLSVNSLCFMVFGPAAPRGCDSLDGSHASNGLLYPVILSRNCLSPSTVRRRICELMYLVSSDRISPRFAGFILSKMSGCDEAVREIRTSHKRPAQGAREPHFTRRLFKLRELLRRNEFRHRKARRRRSKILANRNDVTADLPEVRQNLKNLVESLSQAEHQAGLGQKAFRRHALHSFENSEGALVVGARPDGLIQSRNGLDVVAENRRTGRDDLRENILSARKIGRQNLDGRMFVKSQDFRDSSREVAGAAIGKVVASDGSYHRVTEAKLPNRFGDSARLLLIHGLGRRAGHSTKTAISRAALSQNHYGRDLSGKALPYIRAAPAFTDCGELQLSENASCLEPAAVRRKRFLQPLWETFTAFHFYV